jgi:hypothetical protein
MRITLFTLPVVLFVSSFTVQAKMYKWVDEDGQMHFGDKIPQKYLVKEHDELNEHGVKTKHREAVKTADEKAKERRFEQERKKAALAEKKQKQLDRVLLDTYTTERDLIVARDSRLDALASQIQLSEAYISDANKKIESMEKQVAQIKEEGRELPIDLQNRLNSEKQQVAMQTEVMKGHKKRSEKISAQFNGYIERFRVVQQR